MALRVEHILILAIGSYTISY